MSENSALDTIRRIRETNKRIKVDLFQYRLMQEDALVHADKVIRDRFGNDHNSLYNFLESDQGAEDRANLYESHMKNQVLERVSPSRELDTLTKKNLFEPYIANKEEMIEVGKQAGAENSLNDVFKQYIFPNMKKRQNALLSTDLANYDISLIPDIAQEVGLNNYLKGTTGINKQQLAAIVANTNEANPLGVNLIKQAGLKNWLKDEYL
jgi:hypothetical protein